MGEATRYLLATPDSSWPGAAFGNILLGLVDGGQPELGLDPDWTTPGLGLDSAWIRPGPRLDSAWTRARLPLSEGLGRDRAAPHHVCQDARQGRWGEAAVHLGDMQ